MSKQQQLQLKNRLKVILCEFPVFDSLFFNLTVNAGSRYETRENNGITHLTEHIISRKMFDTLNNHKWIKHYITSDLDAFTNRSITNYHFYTHKNDFQLGIKLIKDNCWPKNLNNQIIKTEKNRIIEEILENKAEPFYEHERLVEQNYIKNNAFSYEILGTPSSLKKISKKDIEKFIQQYYAPNNMVLVISGNFSANKLIKSLKENLNQKPAQLNTYQKINSTQNKIIIKQTKSAQNYFSLYQPIFDIKAEDFIKLNFLTEILNSYLYYNLENKLSLYNWRAGLTGYDEFANFFIETQFNPGKTELFSKQMLSVLNTFKKSLTNSDLKYLKQKQAKNNQIDNGYPRLCAETASFYKSVFNQNISYHQIQKIIDSITLKELDQLFDQLIDKEKRFAVITGKIKNKNKIQDIWKLKS